MNDLEIFEYIKISRIQQKTQEEIYGELIAKGVTVDRIQKQFDVIAANQSPAAPQVVAPVQEKKEPVVPLEEVKKPIDRDTQPHAVKILVTIGTLFIAIGVFYFIAANWQGFSSSAKILVIMTAMILSYGLGWFIREKTDYRIIGTSLIILGTLIYGAAIFLIAQIFQIQAKWPDGFVLWMLGTLAVAIATEIRGTFVIALLLGFVAVFGYPWYIFELFFRLPSGIYVTSMSLMVISTAILFYFSVAMNKRLPPKEEY